MPDVAPDRSRWGGAPMLGIALLGACMAVTAVWFATTKVSSPGEDAAETGFARDMATHHAQAAEMAFMVRDASTDQRLRTLAYDIIVTQTAQRGIFMGWLQQWKLPQASSGPRMAWMPTHDHGASMTMASEGALMPGMATAGEIARLQQATGNDEEILFLQLMIRHHEGGVLMARALVAQSSRDEVVTMAKSIDSSQTVEIALMTEMLSERGAAPFPSLLK